MTHAALLRHQTAPGESHFDWLLALDDAPHGEDDRVLWCFRVAARIDELAPGAVFEAQRIENHRWRYLSYEGALSGDRGRVERVAAGLWNPVELSGRVIAGTLTWAEGMVWSFDGAATGPDTMGAWRFQTAPPDRR